MKRIKVNIKQNKIKYEIRFSENIFEEIKKYIKDYKEKNILFVIDDYFYSLYKKYLNENIKKINGKLLLQKHGEKNKNIKSVYKIINVLNKEKFTKKDYIVSLGGGVTGDISGFASSLFKRGINFIQVPTTLLAMFDSSVGGKTGVDYNGIKNGIGTFYNPSLVIINKNFIETLDRKEIRSGFFEGLKHSILLGKKYYQSYTKYFENFNNITSSKDFESIISKNINYKLKVVKSDPTETNGKRRILNYGHTFGHAVETHNNFKLGHGICVGIGILFANFLSHELGFLKEKTYLEIDNYIKNKIKKIKIKKLDFEKLYSYMANDKKNENKKIKFILLKNYSKTFEHDIDKNKLEKIHNKFIKSLNI